MSVAAWESLHKATLELAKSSGLKQRLTDAWSRHLEDLSANEIPGELREDFESLRLAMTRVRPLAGEGAVAATVRKMSMREADDCASRIVALLDTLHRNVTAVSAKANGRAADSQTVRIPTLISVNRA
ncbi:MAG: hypothetical protein ACT4UQ_05875 [Gammaproteobacteria bacterium]